MKMPNTYIGIQLQYAVYCVMLVILTLISSGAVFAHEVYECNVRWKRTGLESRYQFFEGCQIKILDEWVTEERYLRPKIDLMTEGK